MTTNYKIKYEGQTFDLVEIFKSYTSGTKAQPTNYIVSNYDNKGLNVDFADIFSPYIEGQQMAPQTNYLVNVNGEIKDLNKIFAQINNDLYIATGSYSVSSNSTYNTIITYTGDGTFELLADISVDILMVGGGGSGGNRTGPYISVYNNGGGGGGGQVLFITNQNLTPNSVFNITIGTFGNRNNNTQGFGGSTIMTNNITNYTVNGGNPGQDGPSGYLQQASGGVSGGNSGNGGIGGCSNNSFSSFEAPGPGDNGTNYSVVDNTYYGAGGGGGGYTTVFNGGNTGGGGTYFWSTTSLNASANTGSGGGGGMNGIAPGNGGTGILKILFNQ